MPTIAQQPGDIQWIIGLANSTTTYSSLSSGIAAAVALSAANGNAIVWGAQIDQVATAPTSISLANVQMPPNSIGIYVNQLASAGGTYPLDTALVAAYALSAANGSQPVLLARVIGTLTAP